MGKRLERNLLNAFCGIVIGDRGCGKSTLFAYIVDIYKKQGYEVYCQYPYKGCKQLPLKETNIKGVIRYDVDKKWLYTANFSHSCVLIDEARTVWPARGYAKWTQADEDFFNFIRKNDTHLFMATQAYDGLDLNCRRAADYTYFMSLSWFHFSHIEASHTKQCKVADKNTEVVGRMFKSGMAKVTYDICEVPAGNFYFWRKRWYNKFISTYTFYDKPIIEMPEWDEIVDFKTLQEEQGYVEQSDVFETVKRFFAENKERFADFLESKYYEYDKINEAELEDDEEMTDEEFWSKDE